MATMTERRVTTWDQGTLGGSWVRFHSETVILKGVVHEHLWECESPSDCDLCHEHERNQT